MRKTRSFVLTLLLTAALLTAEIILVKSTSGEQPQGEAVYAASKIIAGTLVTSDMLKVKKISLSAIHKYSLSDANEAAGKVACADIEQDEMILSTRLTEQSSPEIIRLLGENSRLISVGFEADHANAWQLETGVFVDIIYIPDNAEVQMPGSTEYFEQVLPDQTKRYENIRIAGVVDAQGKIIKGGDRDSDASDSGSVPKYVVLEVEKGLDDEIALAKMSGTLELSVRR